MKWFAIQMKGNQHRYRAFITDALNVTEVVIRPCNGMSSKYSAYASGCMCKRAMRASVPWWESLQVRQAFFLFFKGIWIQSGKICGNGEVAWKLI